MTKMKLVLTAMVVLLYGVFLNLYNLYESPIRGTANAQQLNDSVHDYAWGKFVASDGIPHLAFWVMILVLAIIWLFGKKKQ